MCIPSYLLPNTSPAQDRASVRRGAKHSHHLCNSRNIKQNVVPMPFREKLLKTNENSPFIGLFSPPPQNFVSNKLDKEFYASSSVGEKKNCHYSYFQKHVYPLLASSADRSWHKTSTWGPKKKVREGLIRAVHKHKSYRISLLLHWNPAYIFPYLLSQNRFFHITEKNSPWARKALLRAEEQPPWMFGLLKTSMFFFSLWQNCLNAYETVDWLS